MSNSESAFARNVVCAPCVECRHDCCSGVPCQCDCAVARGYGQPLELELVVRKTSIPPPIAPEGIFECPIHGGFYDYTIVDESEVEELLFQWNKTRAQMRGRNRPLPGGDLMG